MPEKQDSQRYSLARVTRAIMAGLGLGLAVTAIHTCAGFLPGRMLRADFAHFYLSANLLQHHLDVYSVPLKDYARRIHFPSEDLMDWETNPPVLMWFFSPLACLPISGAFWSFVAVEVGSLIVVFGSAAYFIRRKLSNSAWMLAVGLTLFSYPVLYHFWLSQVQLPVLALIFMAYWCWRRDHPKSAIVIFALAGTLKLFPLVFVPLPAFAERGRTRLQLLAVGLTSVLSFAMIPGTSAWISFAKHALPFLHAIAECARSNYTLPFLMGRLSMRVAPSTCLETIVEVAATLGLIGYAWWCCNRTFRLHLKVNYDYAFCLMLVTSVLASPIAWAHYLVFMIYPLLRIAADISGARRNERVWLSVLVLASFSSFNLADIEWVSANHPYLWATTNENPVIVLILLYLYFARRVRGDSSARGTHEPALAAIAN